MIEAKDYKTKSYFKKRKSPSCSNAWIIALDVGYSAVKLISPNLAASFPSIAVRIESTEFIGELPNDCIRLKDHQTGDMWVVGQAAQDTISDEDTNLSTRIMYNRNRYENPMFKALIQTGLGLAYMPNEYGSTLGREIYVQTGLPLEYLDNEGGENDIDTDKEMLAEVIEGPHNFTLWVGNQKPVTYNMYIEKDHIYTIEQPRGTLFSIAIDDEGNVLPNSEKLFSKKGLVFDAGSGTLDIFNIRNNRIDGGQTWTDLGMYAVMQETVNLIKQEYGVRISVPALQKYLDTGKIRYHKGRVSKSISISELLEQASKKVCKNAIDRLFQTYPLYEYDYLVITGGTGDAWKDYIREELKEMETLEVIDGNRNDVLPMIFSNVRGFYLYRYMHLK